MSMLPVVLLLLIVMLVAAGAAPGADEAAPPPAAPRAAADAPLRERFAHPPNANRIYPILHGLRPPSERRPHRYAGLLARGFGGVVCNVSFEDYLDSADNWQAFGNAVHGLRDNGMTVWLYDEKGYPSGTAGGKTLEGHPEWEARGLLCAAAEADAGPVSMTLPEGDVIAAAAYPVQGSGIALEGAIDVRDKCGADRTLNWQSPGDYRVLAFVSAPIYEGTHAAVSLWENRRYINLLQREPTARFIELTHQAYAEHLPDLGEVAEAMFTDEPSLMSAFMRPMPHPAAPWSPDLAERFHERWGYDLIEVLPALFMDAGPTTGKVRCDFWELVGELVAESYFGQIQDWCRAHGIASTGHLLAEERLTDHVGYYGNAFACLRRLDIPGIDCLTSVPGEVNWYIAKLIGSVADLEGRAQRMSETSDHIQRHAKPPRSVTPDEIRGTANLLYLNGINGTTSYYNWQGIEESDLQAINDYVGRLGVMLTGGRHVCDLAVYYPLESEWTHFTPARHGATGDAEANAIDVCWRTVSQSLFAGQRDFDYVDYRALEGATIEDDALRMGDERYRVVVLPRLSTMSVDLLRKLRDFWHAGGAVIAVETLPENSREQFPDPEVASVVSEIFGRDGRGRRSGRGGASVFVAEGEAANVDQVIDGLLMPDLRAQRALRYTHRRFEGRDWYFVINHTDRAWQGRVLTHGEGDCEIWDPADGSVTPAVVSRDGEFSRVEVSISPYGSLFLSFEGAREPKRANQKRG